MVRYLKGAAILLCVLSTYGLSAQRSLDPSRGSRGGSQQGGSDINSSLHQEPDTLDVGYYYAHDQDTTYRFRDTLMQSFHEFDLNSWAGTSYFNLGFPGSPVRSVLPSGNRNVAFHLGLASSDPYRVLPENLRFYRLKKAFTNARYTRGPSQEDGVLSLQFGRDFKDGISISLDYRRYLNSGFYRNQSLRNTNVAIGLRYQSKSRRFAHTMIYSANRFGQNENGGITTDTSTVGEFETVRENIPVSTVTGSRSDDEYGINLQTTYALLGDSANTSGSGVRLGHDFSYQTRRYLFIDDEVADSSYYKIFNTDDRGLRSDLDHRQIQNQLFARLAVGKNASGVLKLGIKNISHRVMQGGATESFLNWIAFGDTHWQLTPWLNLSAQAELGVGAGSESYALKSQLFLDLGSAGKLMGKLDLSSTLPSRIAQRLIVSRASVWQNSFKNLLQNQLEISYHMAVTDLQVTAGQLLLTNGIYYNEDALPQQDLSTASLTYLKFRNRIRLGILVSENKITLQFTGNDQLFRTPSWHTENSLYLSGALFKGVLDVDTGFDLRIFAKTKGITYHPLIGQFILDEEFNLPVYPMLDFRVGFRVKYFRAFVKIENILQPLRDDLAFQTSRYPQQDLSLRIGIGWTFIN